MREQLGEIGSMPGSGRLMIGRDRRQDSYYAYDEWDYVLADYRRNWCRLREIEVAGDDGDFYSNTLQRYAEMLPRGAPPIPAHPARFVSDGARTRRRRGNRFRSRDRDARRAHDGRDSRRPRVQGAQERSARRRDAVPARHVGLDR